MMTLQSFNLNKLKLIQPGNKLESQLKIHMQSYSNFEYVSNIQLDM